MKADRLSINKRLMHMTAYRQRIEKSEDAQPVAKVAEAMDVIWAAFLARLPLTDDGGSRSEARPSTPVAAPPAVRAMPGASAEAVRAVDDATPTPHPTALQPPWWDGWYDLDETVRVVSAYLLDHAPVLVPDRVHPAVA